MGLTPADEIPRPLSRCGWSTPARLGSLASDEKDDLRHSNLRRTRSFAQGGRRPESLVAASWSRTLLLVTFVLFASHMGGRGAGHLPASDQEAERLRSLFGFGVDFNELLARPSAAVAEAAQAVLHRRNVLKAGSVYQNRYMTLWNANRVPISVTLRVLKGNRFELLVSHLNSVGGGSAGWLAVRGSFRAEHVQGAPGRLQLVPDDKASGKDVAFLFDPNLLDRATAFMYRCLERVGGGVQTFISAVRLEVDIAQDAVIVAPSSSLVKSLWNAPVVLSLTSPGRLWKAP